MLLEKIFRVLSKEPMAQMMKAELFFNQTPLWFDEKRGIPSVLHNKTLLISTLQTLSIRQQICTLPMKPQHIIDMR